MQIDNMEDYPSKQEEWHLVISSILPPATAAQTVQG